MPANVSTPRVEPGTVFLVPLRAHLWVPGIVTHAQRRKVLFLGAFGLTSLPQDATCEQALTAILENPMIRLLGGKLGFSEVGRWRRLGIVELPSRLADLPLFSYGPGQPTFEVDPKTLLKRVETIRSREDSQEVLDKAGRVRSDSHDLTTQSSTREIVEWAPAGHEWIEQFLANKILGEVK